MENSNKTRLSVGWSRYCYSEVVRFSVVHIV